jgi:hypothetical protein
VDAHGFVLLVGGLPFEIQGRPPAPEGGAVMVRVLTETDPPEFEVVPDAPEKARAAALRALLGQLLRRGFAHDPPPAPSDAPRGDTPDAVAAALRDAVRERLATPSLDLVHYLETGILRLALALTPGDPAAWQLDIAGEARGAGADRPLHTVTLFAELPALGPVETRLTMTAGRLDILFVVAGEQARRLILEGARDLESALVAAGFGRVHVGAQADPARLARDRAADDLPIDPPGPGGLLDVHV